MMESNNITSHSTHVGFEALQDTKNIVEKVSSHNFNKSFNSTNLYGNGDAANKIIECLLDHDQLQNRVDS